MLKTLVVGAGRVAQHYAKILNSYKTELSDFSITDIVDINIDKARLLTQDLNGRASTSLKEALAKSDCNLVLVLTPSYLHFEHAKLALMAGRHVLIEKPSTLVVEESYSLKQIAAAKNLKLGTVVQNRLNHATQFAKRAIESGLLGKIQTVAVRLVWCRTQEYYKDEWHGRWQTDGGVLSQQGFHHLDIARFLCGEIVSVFSQGKAIRHKVEVDDTSVGVLEFQSGALGTIEFSTAAPGEDLEASIKVVGSKGYIDIGGIALNKIMHFYSEKLNDKQACKVFESYSEDFSSGYGLSHYRVLKLFGQDITKDQNQYFSWDDTVKTLELIHALYVSQESKMSVSLSKNIRSSKLGATVHEN